MAQSCPISPDVGAGSQPPQSNIRQDQNPMPQYCPMSGAQTWIPLVCSIGDIVSRLIPLVYNDKIRGLTERINRLEEEGKRRDDQRAQDREAANTTANVREALSKRREDEARAETQKAKEVLQKGIRPLVRPTEEQLSAARSESSTMMRSVILLFAKKRVQYDDEKCHFAVCGTSGSGKSSLINTFRGLKHKDEGAAEVGETECTSEVTRYPDPRNEFPYSQFVWYDIPGAGTINVSDWQYFNDQGLFVFDFIVIVYDARFTKINEGIIRNCLLFNIPFFVVRSKADQHIQNMMNDMDEECERQKVVDKYVKATRSDFDASLKKKSGSPGA